MDSIEISRFVQKLHAEDPYINPPSSVPATNSTPFTYFNSPSTTPPGSPKFGSFPFEVSILIHDEPASTTAIAPAATTPKAKNKSNLNASTSTTPKPCFSTPLNQRIPEDDSGASVTPSKEIESALDRAIDEHLAQYAREGKVFTPAGQRISTLFENRFGTTWSPVNSPVVGKRGG